MCRTSFRHTFKTLNITSYSPTPGLYQQPEESCATGGQPYRVDSLPFLSPLAYFIFTPMPYPAWLINFMQQLHPSFLFTISNKPSAVTNPFSFRAPERIRIGSGTLHALDMGDMFHISGQKFKIENSVAYLNQHKSIRGTYPRWH